MTRLLLILVTIASLLPCSVIAQDEVPWLSLSRLSLTASSSYHFSPWKKYNESLQLAQEAIQYDSYYAAPKGSFEKILGDGTIEVDIGYRLVEELSLYAIGGYTTTSSDDNFSYTVLGLGTNGEFIVLVEPRFSQKVKLNIFEYGIGARYSYEISKGVKIFSSTSASRSDAKFNFDYEYQRLSQRYVYSVEMLDAKYSYRVGVGIQVNLFGPINLNSSIEYRWLKFADFQGDGTYLEQYNNPNSSYEYSQTFQTHLGESDGYFGIYSLMPNRPIINEHLLHILWRRTSVGATWYSTKKPATLELSGIGINLGVQLEF